MTPREFLLARGAADVPHQHGTLLDHLSRVAARLASWDYPPEVVTAGLVHVAYSTDGVDTALLSLDEREVLRAVVGAPAEELAYRFGATDQPSFLRQLGQPLVVWTDRFTRRGVTLDPPEVAPLVALWAANELDALVHSPALLAEHGPALLAVLTRARGHLPATAWDDVAATLSV